MTARAGVARTVGLVLATVVLAFLAMVAGERAGWAAAAMMAPAPATVSGIPALPDDFPDAGRRHVPEVTVPQVTDWLGGSESWTCGEDTMGTSVAEHSITCEADTTDDALSSPLSVTMASDDEEHVVLLSAACEPEVRRKDCVRLFAEVAALPLAGQPDRVKEARRWIRTNLEGDEAAIIGDVHVLLPVPNPVLGTTMTIRPAA